MVTKPPVKKKAEALIIGFGDDDAVVAPAKNPFANRPVLRKNRPAVSSTTVTNTNTTAKDKKFARKG